MDQLFTLFSFAQAQPDILQTQMSAGDSTTSGGSFYENALIVGRMLGIIFLVFILPFIVGKFLAGAMRMANHATRFGLVLASIIGGTLICSLVPMRYGIDIRGGTNLVYELDKSDAAGKIGKTIKAADLVPRLAQRLNPSGTKEIVIRPSGDDQIEIVIPNVDPLEIAAIKQSIEEAGILNFMVLANRTDHPDIIQLANKQATSDSESERLKKDVEFVDGETRRVVGKWQAIGREDKAVNGIFPYKVNRSDMIIRDSKTGQVVQTFPPNSNEELAYETWLLGQGISDIQVLVALEKGGVPYQVVTGDDLETTRPSMGKNGYPTVDFSMKTAGAQRLQTLTFAIRPDVVSGFRRALAIVLDGKVLSAPDLNDPISKEGIISGRFSQNEVKYLVNILESGSLPATLNKVPIAENQVSANMGKDAINKAFYASLWALLATFVFVILYYGFSGSIAAVALIINLLLIMAGMLLIQQPLTLSGLAGIILSVGMSFDANVLVFERIREEIAKKSTGRMAIRNGFERAWTTIFDSNFTTLITAVVLYWLGTDQVRGFAVSLIIGLVVSMFTAVFCSHVFFDIAERLKIVNFWMADAIAFARRTFLGDKDLDFMKWRKVCYVTSSVLILIGLVAAFMRGRELFDIDFNGGTSATFSVSEPIDIDEAREVIRTAFEKDEKGAPIQTSLTSVELRGFKTGTVFKLDSSLTDTEDLQKRLTEGFTIEKAKTALSSYQVRLSEPEVIKPAGDANVPPRTKVRLDFSTGESANSARINALQLREDLVAAAKAAELNLVDAQFDVRPVDAQDWTPDSQVGYPSWNLEVPVDAEASKKLTTALTKEVEKRPYWQSINKIQSRVAGQMQRSAVLALVVSMLFIIAYIWFRFQKVAYGLAAVVALVHDVAFTLGCLAISHWLYEPLPFLLLEDFKISLTTIAAFLTIIGYSLNDTIVVFDRIREVKGKSPKLTGETINVSVNQTLGRTILTSSTTILAMLLLYIMGGEGVHGFCFSMLIGILVGTYSSIFIAAPILLWLTNREQPVSRIGSGS
jgi:SecD/SecF fusion protein